MDSEEKPEVRDPLADIQPLLNEATIVELIEELGRRSWAVVIGIMPQYGGPVATQLYSRGDNFACVGLAKCLLDIKSQHAQESTSDIPDTERPG